MSPANSGVPDRLFIFNGRVFFVEFKAPGKKPRPLQLKVHATMATHGAEVYVIDDIAKGEELLNAICTT